MTMTEIVWAKRDSVDHDQKIQNEILDRFVIICVHEIALRLRATYRLHSYSFPQEDPDEQNDLKDRLHALCFLPNYVITDVNTKTEVDAMVSIEGLRPITASNRNYTFRNVCKEPNYNSVSRTWAVVGGERSMLLSISQQSCSDTVLDDEPGLSPVLPISWVGMTLSTGFYLHGVLRKWNFLQGSMLNWFGSAQQRHLNATRADLASGLLRQQFWFWKLFTAAFTIECVYLQARTEGRMDKAIKGGEPRLQALRLWFRGRIRLWHSVTGVSQWEQAKAALEAIVWPKDFPDDALARFVWEEAFGSNSKHQASVG